MNYTKIIKSAQKRTNNGNKRARAIIWTREELNEMNPTNVCICGEEIEENHPCCSRCCTKTLRSLIA